MSRHGTNNVAPNLLKFCCIFLSLKDWAFDDGTAPPVDIVDQWFNLLKDRFREDPKSCVAVHCVAGLGR